MTQLPGVPAGGLRFDPSAPDISYGYYRCQDCDSRMCGGGSLNHRGACASDRWEYVFGPKAARSILKTGDCYTVNPINTATLLAVITDIAELVEQGGS